MFDLAAGLSSRHVYAYLMGWHMGAGMAERPGWAGDFDRPRGTEARHIRGNWYPCERSWRYDPKTGRSRKVCSVKLF